MRFFLFFRNDCFTKENRHNCVHMGNYLENAGIHAICESKLGHVFRPRYDATDGIFLSLDDQCTGTTETENHYMY